MDKFRKPSSPYVLSIRSMTRDDIQSLREKTAPVKMVKLRDIHHNIARLYASGMRHTEVARAVGYSVTRLGILRNNPAMDELVESYRVSETESHNKARDEYYEYVYSAGAKSWRQINEQLDKADEEDEPLPVRSLLAIADSSANRVGYHPKTTSININLDFAAKLESAIARSRRVIDLED